MANTRPTAIVTGSCGLVGQEVTSRLIDEGMKVIGIDNDMRGKLFGKQGTVVSSRTQLLNRYKPDKYVHEDLDLRSEHGVLSLFHTLSTEPVLVVHAAGQPSHDWSAQAPLVDFDLNARATLLLLEAVRDNCPNAVFVFLSTNKVYGDYVNQARFREGPTRYDLDELNAFPGSPVTHKGVNEGFPIDVTQHSPFGCGKVAADLYVQEYGRYFGLKTVCFRCGCITGGAHRGVKLHGFLAYLAYCLKNSKPYTVFGYKGKQVRDNIHARDLASAIWEFFCYPKEGAVYNMGGGRQNSCSVLEAIEVMQDMASRRLVHTISSRARKGDHKWWISDTGKFQAHYPGWSIKTPLVEIYQELLEV